MAADSDGGRDARDAERVKGAALVVGLALGELQGGRVESGRKLLAAALAMFDDVALIS